MCKVAFLSIFTQNGKVYYDVLYNSANKVKTPEPTKILEYLLKTAYSHPLHIVIKVLLANGIVIAFFYWLNNLPRVQTPIWPSCLHCICRGYDPNQSQCSHSRRCTGRLLIAWAFCAMIRIKCIARTWLWHHNLTKFLHLASKTTVCDRAVKQQCSTLLRTWVLGTI